MSPEPESPAAPARVVLVDAFSRVRELVESVTHDLSDELAWYRPDEQANTVAWLVWHLTRVQDDHVADLAGQTQAWPDWREQFALPFDPDETGYAQSPEDVGRLRVGAGLLADYHAAVHEATLRYVDTLDRGELNRVVDRRWDPPVTASGRLVSVLADTLQHLGQAGYVRGLAERRSDAA